MNKILFKNHGTIVFFIYAVACIVTLYLILALSITLSSYKSSPLADSAIVLGAAVWGNEPSPVFKGRIDYAISLYKSNLIKHIYFTGGQGDGDEFTESESAKKYAIEQGVREHDISIEIQSHTTRDNLVYILPLLKPNETILIISDPLHVPRAMKMAKDLGINAYPAPTPFSRYLSMSTKIDLLTSEVYFTIVYWLYGI